MLCKIYGRLLLVLLLFSNRFAPFVLSSDCADSDPNCKKRTFDEDHDKSRQEITSLAAGGFIIWVILAICYCCCVGGGIYYCVRESRRQPAFVGQPMMMQQPSMAMGQQSMLSPYAAPSYGAPGMATAPTMVQGTGPPVQSGPVTTPKPPTASR